MVALKVSVQKKLNVVTDTFKGKDGTLSIQALQWKESIGEIKPTHK
jgi:hypothetical protein